MISLTQIESDLTAALKSRDRTAADTLRGLKTRIQNEKVAKMKDLSEGEIVGLIRSEIKRRKEAAEAFAKGGHQEQAQKEQTESTILEKYLPAQMSEQQIGAAIDDVLASGGFTAKEFGKAMGALKTKVGDAADGATLAKLLKEKLK